MALSSQYFHIDGIHQKWVSDTFPRDRQRGITGIRLHPGGIYDQINKSDGGHRKHLHTGTG